MRKDKKESMAAFETEEIQLQKAQSNRMQEMGNVQIWLREIE